MYGYFFPTLKWAAAMCAIPSAPSSLDVPPTSLNAPSISLKQLTHVMGYHRAKKVKTVELNETAFSYAKQADTLPPDLQKIIHNYLDVEITLIEAYLRSYIKIDCDISTIEVFVPKYDSFIKKYGITQDTTTGVTFSFKKYGNITATHQGKIVSFPSRFGRENMLLDLTFDASKNELYTGSAFPSSKSYIDFYEKATWKPICNLQTIKENAMANFVVLKAITSYKKIETECIWNCVLFSECMSISYESL